MQNSCFHKLYKSDICSTKCRFRAECDTYYRKYGYVSWIEKTKRIKHEQRDKSGKHNDTNE